MRVLILGCLGQDGQYLTELHLRAGDEVIGVARNIPVNLQLKLSLASATFLIFDARDFNELHEIIEKYEPRIIYNLASASSVKESYESPDVSESVNVGIVKNLLEILRIRQLENKKPIKLFQASSSEMFGSSNGLPLNINSEFSPHSPYALHKTMAHKLVLDYRERYNLHLSTGI